MTEEEAIENELNRSGLNYTIEKGRGYVLITIPIEFEDIDISLELQANGTSVVDAYRKIKLKYGRFKSVIANILNLQ